MKVSLYSTDAQCSDLGSVEVAHVTMFDKHGQVSLTFINPAEQSKFLDLAIKHYLLIQMQGRKVTILLEANNTQRVRLRFDY